MLNKKILIIGGTSGFGKQVAIMSKSNGAQVSIIGHNEDRLKKVAGELDVNGSFLDARDVKELNKYFQEHGNFDHVISTLGGAMGGGFLDSSYQLIERTIQEKFFANLKVARVASKYLNKGGSLIFTSGSGGHPYDASGAIVGNQAINTLVAGLAVELAPNFRANAVSPTWTPTGLWKSLSEDELLRQKQSFAQSVPLKRVATIKEVASAYIYLMENEFITGQVLSVDGGVDL